MILFKYFIYNKTFHHTSASAIFWSEMSEWVTGHTFDLCQSEGRPALSSTVRVSQSL